MSAIEEPWTHIFRKIPLKAASDVSEIFNPYDLRESFLI